MDDPKVKFAVVLKQCLEQNSMTAKQLSSLINVGESTISQWLSSGATPNDPNVYLRCSKIFNKSVHFMIWGEEELSGEEAAVREKFREVVAGRFELILRPLKDE